VPRSSALLSRSLVHKVRKGHDKGAADGNLFLGDAAGVVGHLFVLCGDSSGTVLNLGGRSGRMVADRIGVADRFSAQRSGWPLSRGHRHGSQDRSGSVFRPRRQLRWTPIVRQPEPSSKV